MVRYTWKHTTIRTIMSAALTVFVVVSNMIKVDGIRVFVHHKQFAVSWREQHGAAGGQQGSGTQGPSPRSASRASLIEFSHEALR